MSEQSYQFMLCYTTPTLLGYQDQIETYLMDSLFDKFHIPTTEHSQSEQVFDTYYENMDIYLSSNINYPQKSQNISIKRANVICNAYDTEILWKTNGFNTVEEDSQKYITQMKPLGDIYVFTINIPKYTPDDSTTKYNNMNREDLMKVYGITTLIDLGLIDTCQNNETMPIGKVIVLVHKSKSITDYITCSYYDEFLQNLKWLE